tara:strand:+ start:3881 stop:4297 length:417 start_codon:yes stop_codon:yes gene_type:complete
MITYINQIDTVVNKVANIIGDEVSIPITMNEHLGNHSILILPQEDNLGEILANGQTRDYTILISYELNIGGNVNENSFKQLSNTVEHLKRLFAPDNNANLDTYWFNGRIENVSYERDEEDESKIRAIMTFNCSKLEAS